MKPKYERAEISWHEVKIFAALSEKKWMTVYDVSKKSGIPRKTCQNHMLRFCHLNLVDLAEVFPRHHYRLSKLIAKRNLSYLTRLKHAAEVLGVRLPIKL